MFKFSVKCTSSRFAIYCTWKSVQHRRKNVAACIFLTLLFSSSIFFCFHPPPSFVFHITNLEKKKTWSICICFYISPQNGKEGRCTVWSNDDVGKMMLAYSSRSDPFLFTFRFGFFLLFLVSLCSEHSVEKLKWGKMYSRKGNWRWTTFTNTNKRVFTKEPIL
jgi:hypothetical protein